jgi:hypothetical protein
MNILDDFTHLTQSEITALDRAHNAKKSRWEEEQRALEERQERENVQQAKQHESEIEFFQTKGGAHRE